MAITINGKVYRNLQEQVEKNKDDIEALELQLPYNGPYETTSDIPSNVLVNGGIYLIGSSTPYVIYKYDEDGNSFTNLGNFGAKGDTGDTGATGPQGPEGPQGERGTKTFTYSSTIPMGLVAISASLISSENRPVKAGDIIVSTDNSTDGNYAIALADETAETIYLTVRGVGNVRGPQGEPGLNNVIIIDYGDTTIDLADIFDYLGNGYDLIVREYADDDGFETYNDYKFESAGVNSDKTRYQFSFYSLHGNSSYYVSEHVWIDNYTDPNTVSWSYEAVRLL